LGTDGEPPFGFIGTRTDTHLTADAMWSSDDTDDDLNGFRVH
jgi:hypothetical protein